MNNIKDKLIEIAKKAIADNAIIEDDCIVEFDYNDFDHACEDIADNILANFDSTLADSELVKLPCKIGDDVWIICDNRVCLGYVRYFKIQDYMKEVKLLIGITNRDYYKNNCNYFVADHLNRTWFLSSEQAEVRLKELQGEVK